MSNVAQAQRLNELSMRNRFIHIARIRLQEAVDDFMCCVRAANDDGDRAGAIRE